MPWCARTDSMKSWWRHQIETFSTYWPFVRGIHRSPVNFPHKGQWRGALKFSLICAWTNGWVNNRHAGDLRRHRANYDVTVMKEYIPFWFWDIMACFRKWPMVVPFGESKARVGPFSVDNAPADTRCNNNIIITSKRRCDVIIRFLLRRVSVGVLITWL